MEIQDAFNKNVSTQLGVAGAQLTVPTTTDATGENLLSPESLPQTLSYNSSGQLSSILAGPDVYGNNYLQTLSYTSGYLMVKSAWVKQLPSVPIPIVINPAPTGALVDVQAAVNAAALGSVVDIPAGTWNWGTGELTVPAGIHIRGAGKDVTIIQRRGAVAETARLIRFDGSNGRQAIMSNLTLDGNNTNGIDDYGLGLVNSCIDFYIHDCKFTHFAFAAADVRGDPTKQRGLFYNCDFIDNYAAGRLNLGYGISVYGNDTWPALALGTQTAVFVENCTFSGNRHSIASNAGARYVFRYNTCQFTTPVKDYAQTDAHGWNGNVGARGTRQFEIYNNTYTSIAVGTARTSIGLRGGDGVVFNNTSNDGNISRFVELDIEGTQTAYPQQDQIRAVNIWSNTQNSSAIVDGTGVISNSTNVQLGRDYFLASRTGYTAYTYPHPLRDAVAPPAPPPAAETRSSIYDWPFAVDSIWNMPLGDGATYVASGLSDTFNSGNSTDNTWAPMPGTDPEIIILSATSPATDVRYNSAGWTGGDRCATGGATLLTVPIPASYIVPNSNTNNCAVVLRSDARTIEQMQPFTRCSANGPATSIVTFTSLDLYGPGIQGSHGGSGLSAIGGSIRRGELRPGQVGMRHALKVNVYAKQFLYNGTTNAECYRWPADRADSYAATQYGTNAGSGLNSAMKMGALLAIPPGTTLASLSLETDPAKQIFWTLQNYGAYIVDDTWSPGFSFCVETGPNGSFESQFQSDWGYAFAQRRNTDIAWVRDIRKLVNVLQVVDNNTSTNIGGGGVRRQPLAPVCLP